MNPKNRVRMWIFTTRDAEGQLNSFGLYDMKASFALASEFRKGGVYDFVTQPEPVWVSCPPRNPRIAGAR